MQEQENGRRQKRESSWNEGVDPADPSWLSHIRNLHGADLASPLRPAIVGMNDALRQRTPNRPNRQRPLRSQLSLRGLRRTSCDSASSSLSSGSARQRTAAFVEKGTTTLERSASFDQKPATRSVSPTPIAIMPAAVSERSHLSVPSVSSNSYPNLKPAARCISPSFLSMVQNNEPDTRSIAAPPPPPQLPPRFSSSNIVGQTIEISPGVILPLRGAVETWECIKQDFFVPATCFSCTSEVCCIQDASFVLCPVCRVVGPLDEGSGSGCGSGGVGLGFSFDDLFRWQAELLQEQRSDRLKEQQSISSNVARAPW